METWDNSSFFLDVASMQYPTIIFCHLAQVAYYCLVFWSSEKEPIFEWSVSQNAKNTAKQAEC